MTLTSIIKYLSQEHHLIFVENQQQKDFDKLSHTEAFIKALILQADNSYLYVFENSMTKNTNDKQFDLLQVLFIYDALLNFIDEGTVNIDKILGNHNG